MKTANIIPATNIARGSTQIFSYAVPSDLEKEISVGMVVEVPFGSRIIPGVVEALDQKDQGSLNLKTVRKIIWNLPIVTPPLIELAKYLSDYYLVSLGLVLRTIITKYAPRAKLAKNPPRPASVLNLQLTDEQKFAIAEILREKRSPKTFLLHGVTGSGKTEVYLNVIRELLLEGKQALVLVPEIILTPQILDRFSQRFGESEIAVVHSKISYGQKSQIWEKVFAGEIKILIGPRSAVFAPFKNLGLIVIDEEHDSSHKQFDQNPKYHVKVVAQKLCQIWNCPLVLGDATPSVESYYLSENGIYQKLQLTKRIFQEMPPVALVDMRKERQEGNFSIFSELLIEKMKTAQKNGLKTLLLLNRRGSATSLACRDCGKYVECLRCTVPLIYHQGQNQLICHHCDRKYSMPAMCSYCKSVNLRLSGTGTEKVEAEISKIFPGVPIRRADRDTIVGKASLLNLYNDFLSPLPQIFVGTQLLAKGWDFSTIGLIGIINADTTLNFPDYRSNERTFQLVTQVAGRTSRGEFPGEVVLQSYNPENFALQAAITHNYVEFFKKEIIDRREYHYPPFTRIIKLTATGASQNSLYAEAEQIKNILQPIGAAAGFEVLGPVPAFIPKIRGRYYCHVIIKMPVDKNIEFLPAEVSNALKMLKFNWSIDIDPESLL